MTLCFSVCLSFKLISVEAQLNTDATFYVEDIPLCLLTFWHRSFTFNSNKSPTWCNSFSVYYPDVCLQLNKFQAFFRPSSGAQWLQWQHLVLPSYLGDSRAVVVVGPAGRWERDFIHPTRPVLGSIRPPIRQVTGLFPKDRAAATLLWPSTPCSAEELLFRLCAFHDILRGDLYLQQYIVHKSA